jgi:hypothetical protein
MNTDQTKARGLFQTIEAKAGTENLCAAQRIEPLAEQMDTDDGGRGEKLGLPTVHVLASVTFPFPVRLVSSLLSMISAQINAQSNHR